MKSMKLFYSSTLKTKITKPKPKYKLDEDYDQCEYWYDFVDETKIKQVQRWIDPDMEVIKCSEVMKYVADAGSRSLKIIYNLITRSGCNDLKKNQF